jgi:glyoxylate reductase/D-3-phosphoglycerate dehydrogenase
MARPVIVIEDDPFTRVIQLVLDPQTSAERRAAFADFFAHDEPDFAGWCARLRAKIPSLAPAEARMAHSQAELRAHLAGADAVIVESLRVGREELDAAARLQLVQKYGALVRNIDTAACAGRGVAVLTQRRRANAACAEHALALMLMLARKLKHVEGLVTRERLEAAGHPFAPFDRRHTPYTNFGRVPGLRTLYGSTLGVIGLGEIGTELALRAAAFGMRVLYHQRNRVPPEEERRWQAQYATLEDLLAQSDWVVPQLPLDDSTRGFLGREQLARIKPGACLVNIARAELIERGALVEALASGRLGGLGLDPLYETPAREDDPLLAFENVVVTPNTAAQPRFNALEDIEELVVGMAGRF